MSNTRAYIQPSDFPLDRVFMTQAEVMRRNPQRHEFLQVEAILHCDLAQNLIVGHRKVRADEFWVRGHLPGRPLLPGVMMCETLAQVASIHAHLELELQENVFMGFCALDKVRFRAAVEPPYMPTPTISPSATSEPSARRICPPHEK